jgi:hypothetical protein
VTFESVSITGVELEFGKKTLVFSYLPTAADLHMFKHRLNTTSEFIHSSNIDIDAYKQCSEY